MVFGRTAPLSLRALIFGLSNGRRAGTVITLRPVTRTGVFFHVLISKWRPLMYKKYKPEENDARRHAVAFTGPRPEKLGNINAAQLIAALDAEIRRAVSDGYDTFYSGMSRGIDMTAARLILDMKKKRRSIQLCCAIPFEGQQSRWSRHDKTEYEHLCRQADRTVIVSGTASRGAYLDRNIWMVDHCDRLIAVYDGISGGGTGCTVAYAEKMGVNVIYIDPRAFLEY